MTHSHTIKVETGNKRQGGNEPFASRNTNRIQLFETGSTAPPNAATARARSRDLLHALAKLDNNLAAGQDFGVVFPELGHDGGLDIPIDE